jgi:D-alanyl-D-alanine-carboxypeptidase/D-alanyl-D-alanine-endopeptidase
MRNVPIFLALLVPMAGASPAPVPADAGVRVLGRAWLIDNDGVGLSIGVYGNGQRHFYNFGTTRVDGNKAPTKDTVYEIGAISRTMTVQLLARAIVEGRATINDEAAKYLDEPYPNLENGGEKVRLLHLANMTSQLADNIPDLTQVRLQPGEPLVKSRMRVLEKYTRAEFLRQLHFVAPQRPPGGEPKQSNVATMLLGVVLEKLYAEPFETLLSREIERPLKMGSGTAPPAKLLAQGYTAGGEEAPPFTAKTQYASGSLRYSAEDLLRFASWQLVERDASVKLAHRPTWMTSDRRQAVAFQWIAEESPRGRRLRTSGATYGFASSCDLYPDAGVAVVLLANKAADGAQETLRALSAKIAELASPQPSSADVPPPDR